MKKSERGTAGKEDAILDAAYDVFIEKGFVKTTIADITERAGIAKGTFYLYFESKYDLRFKLMAKKSVWLLMEASLRLDEKATSLEDKTIGLINNIIDILCEDRPMLRFLSSYLNWGSVNEALVERIKYSERNFIYEYRDMVENSTVKYRNPDTMFFLIIELVSSACYNTILFDNPMSMDGLRDDLILGVKGILQAFRLD